MTSHLYTFVGAAVCLAFASFCAYRVWRSLSQGEAVVDVNYLIAWISGRDPDLAASGGTLEFSRKEWPFAFWSIVAVWAALGLLIALLAIGILRSGIQ